MKEIWLLKITQKSLKTNKEYIFKYTTPITNDKKDQQDLSRVIATFTPKRGYEIKSITIEKEIVLLWKPKNY